MNSISDPIPLPGPIKSKIKSLLPVIGLVLILPVIVGAVKLRQLIIPKASNTLSVQVSPGAINQSQNPQIGKTVYLSATVVDDMGQPISGSTYSWGLSTNFPISPKFNFSGPLANFTPTSTGSATLWVLANTSQGSATKNIDVCIGVPCPEYLSSPTPVPVPSKIISIPQVTTSRWLADGRMYKQRLYNPYYQISISSVSQFLMGGYGSTSHFIILKDNLGLVGEELGVSADFVHDLSSSGKYYSAEFNPPIVISDPYFYVGLVKTSGTDQTTLSYRTGNDNNGHTWLVDSVKNSYTDDAALDVYGQIIPAPPTPTPTPRPTVPPQCNKLCNLNNDCPDGYYCYGLGVNRGCRNVQCLTNANCLCQIPTPTPASSPTPIPKPYVRVISPNGGETISEGENYTVFWEASSNLDKINLVYKSPPLPEGNSYTYTLVFNLPNIGSASVKINNPDSSRWKKYKLLVVGSQRDNDLIKASDESDEFFTIIPSPSPTPTPTPTPDPKLTCAQTGGTWREFPDSCADTCPSNQPRVCLTVITSSCDCGSKACWSGTACIPNPPYSSPTPTPTPVANSVPEIVTSSLSPATLGLSYSTNIEGRDADLKDVLKMSLQIPDGYGLQPGPCAVLVAPIKPESNTITCILYGTPIKYSPTPIPIGVVISDNRGGSTRKSLPLTLIADKPPVIETKTLPIARQFKLYTANVVAKSPISNEKVTINISGLPLGLFYSCSIKSPVTRCKIYGSVIYHNASGYPITVTATDSRDATTSTVLRLNTKPWR